jgi:hypothetical protein
VSLLIANYNLYNYHTQLEGSHVSKTSTAPPTLSHSPTRRSSLSKFVFSVHSFPFLEFDLLLEGEDVLLMDKVYESEMFVEHVAVVLDALLEIGNAHILVAITLQGAQEGLFGEAGDLL